MAARRVAAILLAVAWFGGPGLARGQSSAPSAPADSTGAIRTPRPPDERYPPRAVGKGATVGLITGALTGIGFGILVSLYANVNDDDGISAGEGVVISGVFGLLGAGAGVLGGAWVGSLFEKESTDGLPRGTRLLRSIAVSAGTAGFIDREAPPPGYPVYGDGSGGFLGRATLYSHFEPWLAVGAETGFFSGSPHNWRLAGGVRIDPFQPTLVARPYLAGSLGGNFWQGGESLLSADAGIGVEHPLSAGRSAVGLEGRYHWNLQNAVQSGTYNYASLALTWRHDW